MGKFLDAALNGAGPYAGKAFFFKGTKYWQYDWAKDQGDAGPLDLGEWKFPAPFDKGIDAAVECREPWEGKALFFKGTKVIRYDWKTESVDKGWSQDLREDLMLFEVFKTGGKVTAAFNGAGKYAGDLYLFSSSGAFARLDWKKELNSTEENLSLKRWNPPAEVAKGLDTSLSGWGKKFGTKAYFFVDKTYFRYDWAAEKWDLKAADVGAWKLSI